jgi:Holliday junction resolvase
MKTNINKRQKGKRGERAFCDVLRAHGFTARRGQQFSGSPDSPDVVCLELPIHFEVKAGNTHSLDAAFRQCASECGGSLPVVSSKRDYTEWMVYLRASDFLTIMQHSDLLLEREKT